jgi:hypothetical protein
LPFGSSISSGSFTVVEIETTLIPDRTHTVVGSSSDSLLEGAGFEPSVPGKISYRFLGELVVAS